MKNNRRVFKELHQGESLLFLGNAWDTASAIALEKAGFAAIGTTSYGISQSLGLQDGEQMDIHQLISIVQNMIKHVSIPVTVDMEAGYASNTEEIIDHVLRVAHLGVAGINIEDSPKHQSQLRSVSEQAALLATLRTSLDTHGFADLFINARTDTYLSHGIDDPLNETLIRAQAYSESGANGIFVPGLSAKDEIIAVVSSCSLPLNLMSLPGLTSVSELEALGVKRFSFGNALSDSILAMLQRSSEQLYRSRDTSFLYS
ncbi:isocitrate lyase/phosphoenolpyruvate mutase family protein [Saccharibacillus sp. JS10]|uniref:isocitrate lyase/PEP mutase family protein n=1 Tax=Saccharibacillus sp. JS10 TaxID=2950552 RepID=UPI00210D6892|nr:isocitrate lyase/phosphoenolpyruvate mutase family protein [Saccharibacillus sp. JS10]MCQ4088270.1 isocitrate lyase/phosphoenolpyruvate mutase family protein [Saccharibacillus sp. JS10]